MMVEFVSASATAAAASAAAPEFAVGALLSTLHYVASWVLIVSGSFFVLVGAIGLIRMPDVFTRMHATSIIDTLGATLLIVGMMLQAGFTIVTLKLLFIFVLLLLTSPVATHALAQAALAAGERPELKSDRTTEKPEV